MGKASKRKASKRETLNKKNIKTGKWNERNVYFYTLPGRTLTLSAFSIEDLERLIAIHGGDD